MGSLRQRRELQIATSRMGLRVCTYSLLSGLGGLGGLDFNSAMQPPQKGHINQG